MTTLSAIFTLGDVIAFGIFGVMVIIWAVFGNRNQKRHSE